MQELENIFRVLSGPGSQAISDVGLGGLVFLMLLSLASSLFITWLYRYFYSSRATGSEAHRAFPLLGISVTAIFIAIQFSLPLSLGLLGALSIVRFRTPIKEPEEVGFIMLVIASALACATFKLSFLGVILGVSVAALLVQRLASETLTGSPRGGLVVVSVPENEGESASRAIATLLGDSLKGGRLESLSKGEDATVDLLRLRVAPDRCRADAADRPSEGVGRLDRQHLLPSISGDLTCDDHPSPSLCAPHPGPPGVRRRRLGSRACRHVRAPQAVDPAHAGQSAKQPRRAGG